ncbi:hypothetical protein D9619_004166 [Psilocybe cf. subviscida]|uniref:Arrestin-like N-terminal domain-containing protein n=1 Tax=Psilocybe cf. subviscida TaxID=2480587 RepID=A0A8H5F808_9AGAR|nr:hypothetical protein D9619_004166 [Psilocybe cf. subviscida]
MAMPTALHPVNELPTGEPHAPHERLVYDPPPEYAPRAAHVLHPAETREFEYKNDKKGETIASLKILAPAAYSKHIPTFYGAGPVKGSAYLHLTEPETITSVVLSVRGQFSPGHSDSLERLVLFDITKTLWSKDSAEAATDPSFSHHKLSGTHSWPFSISIPERVQSVGDGSGSAPGATDHVLPQTYNERILSASIQYQVILHIGRGKFSPDYEIPCTFGYIPLTEPPPFPPLKTVAYQERTPLLGPTVDVDGWVSAKKINISGTLFNSHPVAIECQLFLSAPLVYTRGSVIPLYMRMQSSNQQALDLLATNKSLTVRLQRRIEYSLPMRHLKDTDNYHAGKDERDLGEAVWWPDPSQGYNEFAANTQTHTICLNGELHLRHDLAPSTTLPAFTIEYNVCLHSVNAPGFNMVKTPVEKSLLGHPVDIVTLFAPGPRSVRYGPSRDDEDRPLVMEFGMAFGPLSNPLPG